MRLYHASEEAGIGLFEPRKPTRADVGDDGLVWAVNERCLPNFLTPRDCPRVTYHSAHEHVVAIEHGWLKAMLETQLYVYEFDPSGFELQDDVAGYYVSKVAQKPINVTKIDDLFAALFERGVEVRILGNLWALAETVQKSSHNWSLMRMRNALPKGS